MSEHPKECAWHVDQYPWECTCGLVYRQHLDRIEQLTAEVERLREALEEIEAGALPITTAKLALGTFPRATLEGEQ